AYGCRHSNNFYWVVDGAESKPYHQIVTVALQVFSPDSRHFGTVSYTNRTTGFVEVDGILSKETYTNDHGDVVFETPTKAYLIAERNGNIYRLEIDLRFD